jgi:hypothetical protein
MVRPILVAVADGRDRSAPDIQDFVVTSLGLTPEDRQELSPGGAHRRFDNLHAFGLNLLVTDGLIPGIGRRPVTADQGCPSLVHRMLCVLDHPSAS